MSDPVLPAIVSQVVHPDVQLAADEVRRTFGEFRTQWRSALERAVENGKAIARLQTVCFVRGVNFTKELNRLGIPTSTAYANLDLANHWEQAQAILATAGMQHEFGSAEQVMLFVKGESATPKPKGKKAEASTEPVAKDDGAVPPSGPTTPTATSCPDEGDPSENDPTHFGTRLDDSPEVEQSIAVLMERFLATVGDKAEVINVREGGSVRVGNKTWKITKPTVLLPE